MDYLMDLLYSLAKLSMSGEIFYGNEIFSGIKISILVSLYTYYLYTKIRSIRLRHLCGCITKHTSYNIYNILML